MLAELQQQGAKVYDAEAAMTFRAIERGARDTRAMLADGGDTAYLGLLERLLQVQAGDGAIVGGDQRPVGGDSPSGRRQTDVAADPSLGRVLESKVCARTKSGSLARIHGEAVRNLRQEAGGGPDGVSRA